MRTRMILTRTCLVVLLLAGCAQTETGWARKDNGALPLAGDISYCRTESRRMAGLRYPDQVRQGDPGHPVPDDRRFRSEIEFYDQCMDRKGYARRS